MEAALDVLARRAGADVAADETASPERSRFPFDPRRRRMSVVAGDRLLVKGAPDAVVPLCGDPKEASAATEDLAARGLRVLAVAARRLPHGVVPATPEEGERDLGLLGLVGIEDPPRPNIAAALADCRRAGVKVAMITGDRQRTSSGSRRRCTRGGTWWR
jgi:magnesium-transporting ATPase (P-type)